MEEMYQQYGQDISFVAVPVGPDAEKSAEYCRKEGYEIPVYKGEGQLFRDYSISDVPQIIFIVRGGQMSRPYDGLVTRRQIEYALAQIQ